MELLKRKWQTPKSPLGQEMLSSSFSQNKEHFSKSRVNGVYFLLNFSIKGNCLIKKKNLSLFALNTTDNLILSQQTPRNKTRDPPEKMGQ